MKKLFHVIFVGVVCLAVLSFVAIIFLKPQSQQTSFNTSEILINNVKFFVEIAKTPEQHQKGLMFREHLDENAGMLFIYNTETYLTFWMKNTYIPLDIIWISPGYEIVDIAQNVPPCTTIKCPIYMPKLPAKYVLEINANLTEKYNIKIGDTVDFSINR